MTTLPVVIIDQVGPVPALPAADIDRAAAFARQDKAPATRKAYRSDFAIFQVFLPGPRRCLPPGHARDGGSLSRERS